MTERERILAEALDVIEPQQWEHVARLCNAPSVRRFQLMVRSLLQDTVEELDRDTELAIALVTCARQSEFPPPDRMRLHGVWYDRSPNQSEWAPAGGDTDA